MNALVVFGTRYGSTEKIAQEIGAVLSDEGYNVRVADAVKETVSDIAEYGVVIVGSGIKIGKWTRKALDFLERFEADLSEKKVALFVSYGYSRKSDRVNRTREDFLMKVAEKYPSIKPVSLGLFDGVFSFDRYGFGERLIFLGIKKDLEKQGVIQGNPTTSEIGKQYVSGQEKLLKVLNFSQKLHDRAHYIGNLPPMSAFKNTGNHFSSMADPDWGRIREELARFLTERLHLFYAVRDSFGIEGLGLGSLPRLHFPNTWMKVVPLVRPHRFFTVARPRRVSLDSERKIIVVESEDAILSVYPKPTSIGGDMMEGFERRFLNISDDALVGGYAHECAAYQIYKRQVPAKFHHILARLAERQRMEDALAAAYSYREELISFLGTHLRLLVYEPKPRRGWFIRGSLSIRDELKDRIGYLKELQIGA